MQVLEGPLEALHRLYFERIAHDPRHHRLQLLAAGVLDRRRFADWHMGFRPATPAALDELTGHLDTANATFWLPRLPNLPSPLLDKLLDYVQYAAPGDDPVKNGYREPTHPCFCPLPLAGRGLWLGGSEVLLAYLVAGRNFLANIIRNFLVPPRLAKLGHGPILTVLLAAAYRFYAFSSGYFYSSRFRRFRI